ncbi:hypothetical protein ILUMI_12792 [Ignelater luminosus]|uniref:CBM39 domain-containing protein n=1 Tax=Ignelater luminosus TaxID=2038154 RepID=A0A8K0GCM1_IGNLU|nr:hypothetical protein ILUMI_12792 [Ignelater luminosus]
MILKLFLLIFPVCALSLPINNLVPPTIHQIMLEATNTGKLRVSTPDLPGITSFRFKANINEYLLDPSSESGKISGKTDKKTGNSWLIELEYPLRIGDSVYYSAYVESGAVGYRRDGKWDVRNFVTEVTDSSISKNKIA